MDLIDIDNLINDLEFLRKERLTIRQNLYEAIRDGDIEKIRACYIVLLDSENSMIDIEDILEDYQNSVCTLN